VLQQRSGPSKRRAKLNINFEALASSEAAGCATTRELELLRAHPAEWLDTLRRLLAETEAALRSAANITGPERAMVLDDLTGERDSLRRALHRLAPEAHPDPQAKPEKRPSDDGRPAAPELPPLPRRCRARGRTTRSCCGPAAPACRWWPARSSSG
jgi:uncharacterized membrane protein YccC